MATSLVEYGISTDQSDLRAHVCFKVKRVYVYQTERARELLATREYRTAPAYQGDLHTAEGYLVPPLDIPGCREYRLHDGLWQQYMPDDAAGLQHKGWAASQIVMHGIANGLIFLPANVKLIEDYHQQLAGIDIRAWNNWSIQVKCDWNGGRRELGGTGNLFLQIAEANPHKLIEKEEF